MALQAGLQTGTWRVKARRGTLQVQAASSSYSANSGRSGSTAFERGLGQVDFSKPAAAPSFRQRLRSLGLAGVLAYGIFNTLYYVSAFTFIWVYVVKIPRGLGLALAARRAAEVMAMTWAGSQVTKVPRAACALVLAPFLDTCLTLLQRGLRLRSRRAAFLVVVAGCVLFALALFGVVVLAWS
ncbi:hypothetical protein WJX72_002662 [[Myrmecia] bisecta]|uniref:Uncharacterized protein n=1 Tax=[Myrmecia] bisecta TaxID=41462 RepID=A0AAW1PEB8_9CHLO